MLKRRHLLAAIAITLGALLAAPGAGAADYPAPMPLPEGAQAPTAGLKGSAGARIASMPPAIEFNDLIAIGQGIKATAAAKGVENFMLAPQSGADINGQMGMIQDVISQGVSAIIHSTSDENATAPLVKRAVDAGIAVVIVNSDIANFPTPVHAVVG